MNKTALMNYALSARKELESQIGLSLNKLGIYEDSIKRADIVGDYTIIEGTEETFPKRVYELRNTIISDHIQPDGFKNVVEEFAYTWFNRIIALRFMEIHDYFDHGFRVLTSRDGSYEPEILKNVMYVIDDLKLNKAVVESLSTQGKTEELYRYILFSQCNRLSGILPMLFSTQEAYMELLLPNNLLSAESVIRKIQEIPEEDFKNDVEVIGWLYQFYNSVKKDEVFASKETITKDTLPAVTQLFTPDWIVRYMAQNSVGRIWLESHPNSPLKEKMKYYVDDDEQTPEAQAKIDAIKYKNVNLETLKVIEPCCGSGHILVYVFDLLFEMYKENGYAVKDIPAIILKSNLYGLDVDKRATQLSQFALMMKARSIDNRFFSETRIVIPHVYEIQDSKFLISLNYQEMIKEFGFTSSAATTIQYLIDTFRDGKVIGSLLKVEKKDYQEVANEIATIRGEYTPNLFQNRFFYAGLNRIVELCSLAEILSSKYDVMITNPPYCGTGNVDPNSKDYFCKYYPESKSDFLAMFMQTDFVNNNGFMTMINLQTWMFLTGYKDFRKSFLNEMTFETLTLMGRGIFGADFGSTSFVSRKVHIQNFTGTYKRLFDRNSEVDSIEQKEKWFLDGKNTYRTKQDVFESIPGHIIAFWISSAVQKDFKRYKTLENFADLRQGLITGDNERFLRYWYEVDYTKIGKKWFTYNKGGNYRKWFGNNDLVVDWENNGYEINNFRNKETGKLFSRPQNIKYYFREGFTWTALSIGAFSGRFMPSGEIFDAKGSSGFAPSSKATKNILGFLNSSVASEFFKVLSPTVDYSAGAVAKIPACKEMIDDDVLLVAVNECIENSKKDWNSIETSINFSVSPYVEFPQMKISDVFEKVLEERNDLVKKQAEEESEINRIIANYYSMSDEVATNVQKDDISFHSLDTREEAKQLISYLVGCIMGRYSLHSHGVLYAGGELDKHIFEDFSNNDGVAPVYRFIGIENGLTNSVCSLIKKIYGEQDYQTNLVYLANALGKKPDESSIDTINRYLNEDFCQDHIQTYQKKPIYWMFSSGKKGAFKCLMYVHRYTPSTLALINTKFFLPRTAMYRSERERLEGQLAAKNLEVKSRKALELELASAKQCEEELFEYGQILDHMANQFVKLDLDDGIKENYDKFQNVTVEMNGQTIKKDLLVHIK